jgi:hypothetical protein
VSFWYNIYFLISFNPPVATICTRRTKYFLYDPSFETRQCTAHTTISSVYCSHHKLVSVLLTAQSTETYRRPHWSIYINPVLGLQVFFWIFEPWGRGTIGCPETSARNCHYSLRNNPEERSSHIPVHSFVWNRSITYCKEVHEGGIRTADITIELCCPAQ